MYKMQFADHGGRPVPILTNDGDQYNSPSLFVGSAGPAYILTALRSVGITHVISVTSGVRPQFPDELEYLHIQGLRD